MRSKMATALIWAAMGMSGCNRQPDYTPFSDGMKAFGICLVVCSVVRALADLISRGEPQQPVKRRKQTPRSAGERRGK
jgi:hypothetical protein